jgi:protein-disulfide isomerase
MKPRALAPILAAIALSAGAGDGPAASPPAAVPAAELTAAQRAVLDDVLKDAFCYCGCPHTVTTCLAKHEGCKHSKRMARLAARYAALGAPKDQIQKILDEYYASFDRRARIDTAGFGPPLGDPSAPIALVVFSDFACPFCGAFRPVLERFVEEHAGRVKLFYKPYPIDGHPGAAEAAQAAEWARDQGIFWKLHDTLYAHPHDLSVDDLVSYAKDLGGDGAALRKALESGEYRAKVEGSRGEARAAGLRATPTLFLDGRRMALPDLNAETLEFTLEDEEEWRAHKRWEHD